ncbi:uncharacterized protein LOC118198041 [Stegodyphus dumicola]|uniref:uncharacterized protein LOC118198041 n=1 Tax=Stegodyphus dumicola TaxID=202533 RepID=UPI0015AD4BA0|nr:uncharacterized protein LOC118198041 [Stegodyphus dumicola]
MSSVVMVSDTDHIGHFAKDFDNNSYDVHNISDEKQFNYLQQETEKDFDFPKPDNSGNQIGTNSSITILNQEEFSLNASIESLDAECIVSHNDLGTQRDIDSGNLLNTNNEPKMNGKLDQEDRTELKPTEDSEEQLVDLVVGTVPVICFDDEYTQHPSSNHSEVLGTCAGVINHDNLAFFGAYSVREEYRLLGIGLKIYTACMERIGARNTAGNAVPGKEELHRDKFKIPIVENKWKLLVNEIYEDISPENLSDEVPNGIYVEHCRNSHLPLIYKYDFNLVGYRRDLAIKLTYEEEDTKSFVAIKDGECVGFGVIKKTCRGVHHLGPLYANDAAVAEAILKRLTMSAPEIKGLYMATVSNNAPANDFLKKLGSPTVEICARVFRRRNDDEEMTNVDTNRVFALFDMHYTPS